MPSAVLSNLNTFLGRVVPGLNNASPHHAALLEPLRDELTRYLSSSDHDASYTAPVRDGDRKV